MRAQRGQGRVNVPQGRLGIDDAGQKGRLCKDTVLLIIWDIHIYLFKCVIYIYTHTHTAQFVRISAPQPGTEALQALGSESRVPTTGPLGNSLYPTGLAPYIPTNLGPLRPTERFHDATDEFKCRLFLVRPVQGHICLGTRWEGLGLEW